MQKLMSHALETNALGSEMGKTASIFRDLSEIFDTIYAAGKQYWDERDALPVDALPDGTMKELLEILGDSPFNSSKTIRDFVRTYDSGDLDLAKEDLDEVYAAARSFCPPILRDK